MKHAFWAGPILLAASVPLQAAEWETELGAGIFVSERSSSDTIIEGSPFLGTYLEGYAARQFGGLRFSVDGRGELTDDEGADSPFVSGPLHTGVIGLHLGKHVNNTLVGGYAAIGFFDGYDSESPMDGFTLGIEAEHVVGNGAFFGQIGYVEAIGDPGDNEFQGPNVRVGYHTDISERLSGMAAIEYAYSGSCFEDCLGDWGKYFGAEIALRYEFADDWEAVGGARFSSITANTEDTGSDSTFYFGVSRSFGKRPTSGLRTPMGGFHAAGWMHPLD